MVRAYFNLDQLRDETRFGAWIYRIAINQARTARRAYSPSGEAWGPESDPDRDGVPTRENSLETQPFEDRLIRQDVVARIRKAVLDLPAAEREAIVLVYLDELSHKEAAQQLGATLSAVKVRVHRGRHRLRAALTDEFGLKPTARLEKTMIKLTIHDIIKYTAPPKEDVEKQETEKRPSLLTPTGDHHVVLLKEENTSRVLPIWIGSFEARSLAIHLKQSEQLLRPLTFDLVKTLLGLGNVEVQRVDIHRLHEEVYYANLVVKTGAGGAEIDCRPSDALNLAVRLDIPVFVAMEIMDSQSREPDETGHYTIKLDKPDVQYESLLAD